MYPMGRAQFAVVSGGGGPTPNITLNWASGTLPSQVTHGGGANGTKWNSSGNLVSGSSGRITFDPATLACLGAYFEGARTNLIWPSVDISNGNYYQDNSTVTVNNLTSPDGTANADTLVGNSVAPGEVCLGWGGTGVPAVGTHVASSCFYHLAAVRPTNFGGLLLYGSTGSGIFTDGVSNVRNVATGAAGSTKVGSLTGTILVEGMQDVGNGGWRRGYLAGFFSGGGFGTVQWDLSDAGTPGGGYDAFGQPNFTGQFSMGMWLPQLETGDFPSSPIVTTTATLTRSADTGTISDATYIADRAFVVQAITAIGLPASGTTQIVAQWDDGTGSNYWRVERDSSGNIHVKVVLATVTVADLVSVATLGGNTSFKVAFRVGTNDYSMSLNGATVVTDTLGVLPAITGGRFGTDTAGANYWFGIASKIDGYTTLTDPQLVTLST